MFEKIEVSKIESKMRKPTNMVGHVTGTMVRPKECLPRLPEKT